MMKLVIFLAICLVCVHAFVRRDAPEAQSSDLSKTFEDLSKSIKGQFEEVFDPEKIKQGLSNLGSEIDKLMQGISKKPADSA